MGERLVALVVPADKANPPQPDDIAARGRTLLAGYKIPKEIHLAESLPRTSVGKLDKKAMRSRHDAAKVTL